MICNKIESSTYKAEFSKKFENFGDKAPILISYALMDDGVEVIHENSGTRYFYEWDFTIPVKSFIHKIMQDLSHFHYPRISREVEKTRAVTEERTADLLASGVPLDEIPKTETSIEKEFYRIQKVIAGKDEFIIIDEQTGEQYLYKMTGNSAIYFLRDYRTKVFKDTMEAGTEFFDKSVLLNKLECSKK